MMDFVVCGDLHLKPGASDYDVDAMVVPEGVDLALILGDLIHRAGPEDVSLARRFVERFEPDVPSVYVPGNHDPAPTEERIVEPFSRARSGHLTTHEIKGLTIVGWGCERRTLAPAINQREFDALDPRDVPREDRRYTADQVAADLEKACHSVVCGTESRTAAATELGIEPSARTAFYQGLAEIEATYELLDGLLADRSDVLLATHVPPFNVSFDRHHAVGTREEDREFLHTGSIPLKLAIREHDVFAALSGHSHMYGYDIGDGVDGRPYCLNLGYRGLGTVTVEPDRGRFAFTREKTE